jgi:hypothetical protein
MNRRSADVSRRLFLKGASAAAGLAVAKPLWAADSNAAPIRLSPEHEAAVNRRRRIVVHYDAFDAFHLDFDRWLEYRFAYIDDPGSQIDAVWWDVQGLQPNEYPSLPGSYVAQKWLDQGIDPIGKLVEESHRRKLEAFWNHRISEVDLGPFGSNAWKSPPHPLKKAHPEWLIQTWWPHGLWNLAVAEVREYILNVLRRLAEKYAFDGFQLDFARHVPCLPPGRQWALRGHVTELLRMVREMTLEVAAKRGRPVLLAARVPRSLAGCRVDGFDIEAWARENLVDILTLASRSIEVDLAGYRRATAGKNIKLQPCFDDHHAPDGYRYAPIEVLRGVFANWWQQGANSIVTFNWSNAPAEACRKAGCSPGPATHRQAYLEGGSPQSLRGKDKVFVVERRGGYPWAEGYFNHNDDAPLPVKLVGNGTPTIVSLRIADELKALAGSVKQLTLRTVYFGAEESDEFELKFNDQALTIRVRDAAWKDPQIFSPRRQPDSGGTGDYKVDPGQRLLRLECSLSPQHCAVGENRVAVRLKRAAESAVPVVLEKLEVHVTYRPKDAVS